MRRSLGRTVAAGIAGGVALNAAMLLTFRLIGFGWNGKGILLDPAFQSPKLIAVWTEIEPLPLIVTNPAPIIAGLVMLAVVHAFIYRWLCPSWPVNVVPRALRFALLVFAMTYVFWEFFTPFNQFGEPLKLIAVELVFWAVIALAEALAIAGVMERRLEKAEAK